MHQQNYENEGGLDTENRHLLSQSNIESVDLDEDEIEVKLQ